MDSQIISAIINGGCVLLGALLGILFSNTKPFKLRKNKYGNYTLPDPFPCSSVFYEGVCSLSDSKQLTFDFGKFDNSEKGTAFISMVYSFPNAISLVKAKKLSFDISFEGSNCTQVDLEIKSKSNSFSSSCFRKNSIEHFEISFANTVDKNVLRCVKEICFVIKPTYHDKDKQCKGMIAISNLILS